MILNKILKIPVVLFDKFQTFISFLKRYNADYKRFKSNEDTTRINYIGFSDSCEADWIKFFSFNNFLPRKFSNYETSSYRPQIEYFSCFSKRTCIKKSHAPIKIFWTGEDVENNFTNFSDFLLPYTDISIGFSTYEKIPQQYRNKYIRYPLYMNYFFTPYTLKRLPSKDEIAQKIKEINLKKSTCENFCSMVASHDRNGIRKDIMQLLNKIETVKSAGKIYHNDDTLFSKFNDNKLDYKHTFMFNICPENTNVDGYVTEKLFQAFAAGCIPIYNGGGNFLEPGIINPKAIIYYTKEIENDVLEQVQELWTNKSAYNKFILENKFLPESVDIIYDTIISTKEKFLELLQG